MTDSDAKFDQRDQQVNSQINTAGDTYITIIAADGSTVTLNRRDAELAYLDDVIRRYEHYARTYTPLAGIAEVSVAVEDGPRLDLPTLFMPTGFEKLIEHGFGQERRFERVAVDDLRTATRDMQRLVILGEPGSGKTTTLHRLAYDLALTARADESAPLPLFVPLGGYTGPEPLLDYASRYFGDLALHLPAYLTSGRLVLLLDALNEMPQRDYGDRVARVQFLLDQTPDLSAVVTCRELDYVETLDLQKLAIKPLDVDQQRAYLHRYLGETDGEALFWHLVDDEQRVELWRTWQAAGGSWSDFWTAEKMPKNVYAKTTGAQDQLWARFRSQGLPDLLELGVNPYMLVMLAQVYAAGAGVLPPNRGKLFAAFVDTLLARERKRHPDSDWPGADPLCTRLAGLAFSMQDAGEHGTAVDRPWAVAHLDPDGDCDPEQTFYLAASATLIDATGERIRFVHQLIQEYFAALAWSRRLPDDDLARYWPDGQPTSTGWEETAILLAGLLDDMTPLVDKLIPVNPVLAARCIDESGGVRPEQATVSGVQSALAFVAFSPIESVTKRHAAGNALNSVGDPRIEVLDPLSLAWCPVPAGEFLMGNTKQTDEMAYDDESPRHPLTLPAFRLSKYPVTVAQYGRFVEAGGYRESRYWTQAGWAWRSKGDISGPESYRDVFQSANHPVVGVSWYEATAYCVWLSEQVGYLVTLPTEAQWEKAARGPDGRRYAWGDEISPEHANYSDTKLRETTTVGIFPKGWNPYGLVDLTGNVWEWTSSLYKDYPYDGSDGRENPDADGRRTLRGGAWGDSARLVRSAFRLYWSPDPRNHDVGFRLQSPGS